MARTRTTATAGPIRVAFGGPSPGSPVLEGESGLDVGMVSSCRESDCKGEAAMSEVGAKRLDVCRRRTEMACVGEEE